MAQIEYIEENAEMRIVTVISFDSDIALLWYLAELADIEMDECCQKVEVTHAD